jgi:signal transduction histidine kinase
MGEAKGDGAQADPKSEAARLEGVERAAYFACLDEIVRGIVHDLNGALNTLSLNVELLDLATAEPGWTGAGAASRARALAKVRGAKREIEAIVALQLLPIGRTAEPVSITAWDRRVVDLESD